MADKLTERSWVDFAKSSFDKEQRKLVDDGALVKALATVEKAGEDKPALRMKALDEVADQIRKQVVALAKEKKALGDKPFNATKDKLYALLELAEAQHKAATSQVAADKAKAAKDDKAGSDGDEEEDAPTLLTTKMVPLLRELRKGEVRMHALICTAGKNTAVLIMRKPIGANRRKLLAELVDAKGGIKYIVGECGFEKNVLSFVVQSSGAQLAKRLRQALLDQTAMRLQVRVRGDDGKEETEGEDDGEEQPGAQAQRPALAPGGPASAEQLAYTQRLLKVRERYEQALRAGHPESTRLRALMGLASEQAGAQHDHAAAIQSLKTLEATLDATPPAPDGRAEPGPAFKTRLLALLPRIKAAAAAAAPSAVDAKLKASEAGVYATKKDFARANVLLDEVEALLDEDAGGEAPGWGARFAQVETRYLAALKQQPASASQLRAAMAAVHAATAQGDDQKAAAALATVESLIDAAGSQGRETDVIPEGLVATRIAAFEQAHKRWEAGVAQARTAMKPIQAGLTGAYAAAAPAIDNILNSYRQDLASLLADAQAAKDGPAVDSATRRLRAKIGALRAEIGAESLFVYLDGAGSPITPTFASALDDIDALIAA